MIVDRTEQQLALRKNHLPGMVVTTLFGFPFLIAGLCVAVLLGQRASLFCQHVATGPPECHIDRSSLRGDRQHVLQPGSLQGAEIEVSEDSDGGDTYRIVLLTQEQRIPLTHTFSSWGNNRDAVHLIDQFVRGHEPQIEVTVDHRWFAFLFGGVFATIGSWLVFGTWIWGDVSTHFVFDKTAGRLRIEHRKLFRHCLKHYHLFEIARVDMTCQRDSDGDRMYGVELALRSGNQVPVMSFQYRRQTKCLQTQSAIAQFLDIPASEVHRTQRRRSTS